MNNKLQNAITAQVAEDFMDTTTNLKQLEKAARAPPGKILFKYTSVISSFNPLGPNINLYILHTVLYTFPEVLTRRISLIIKSFFS